MESTAPAQTDAPDNATFSINEWFNSHPIRIIGSPEEPFFYAVDLGLVLGIKNIRTSLNRFIDSEDIVSSEMRARQNIVTYKKRGNSWCRDDSIILLTKSGVYKLIYQSRSPVAEDIKRKLSYILTPGPIAEAEFINRITAIFSTEVFETQKVAVGTQGQRYRIDLYMPAYNLAIEFDEKHHTQQAKHDRVREYEIQQTMQCMFIRVKDTDDIFAAAGKIYSAIHTKRE